MTFFQVIPIMSSRSPERGQEIDMICELCGNSGNVEGGRCFCPKGKEWADRNFPEPDIFDLIAYEPTGVGGPNPWRDVPCRALQQAGNHTKVVDRYGNMANLWNGHLSPRFERTPSLLSAAGQKTKVGK